MSEAQNIEAIARRIKALKALAGNNPNENEAASCNEKIHELLARHNLSMAEVDTITGKAAAEAEPIGIDGSYESDAFPQWLQLAGIVGKMYFCEYFFETHKQYGTKDGGKKYVKGSNYRHYFVGTQANAVVARTMFAYLRENVEKLARAGALSVPDKERSPYRVAFRHAATDRLCWRIHERIEASKKGTAVSVETGVNLPALLNVYDTNQARLDAFMAPMREKGLKTKIVKQTTTHDKGRHDGRKAGESMGLDQQITATPKAPKLTKAK